MPRLSNSFRPGRRSLSSVLGLVVCVSWVAVACGAGAADAGEEAAGERPPNLLVIIADDVGTHQIGIYGGDESPARTPNIDRLGRKGLVFENFWAMPSCSPSRAALLSGQYPHRTGIGRVVDDPPPGGKYGLPTDVETLPRALAPAGYTSAIAGKWHVGVAEQGFDHPLRMGFAHHRGSFGNLALWGASATYSDWLKVIDGDVTRCRVYATTDTVNDAIELAGELPEPWLLILSFNAAHDPRHTPPKGLHSYGTVERSQMTSATEFRAMVEAMDTETGRLLASVRPQQPIVFFLGDNGAPAGTRAKTGARGKRAKGSLFEGGVHVPFIVNHRSIVAPGRSVSGLANVTDLFATLVELAGLERPDSTLPPDSVSLAPYLRSRAGGQPRDWMLAERFKPNGPPPHSQLARAVRDTRYKLIRYAGGRELLFDLEADPQERQPLAIAALEGPSALAYRRLVALSERPPPIRRAATGRAPASE